MLFRDRVAAQSETTGIGPMTLGAPIASYQGWGAFPDGQVYYGILDEATGEWEIGIGTKTATTLVRNQVLSSSSGGSFISWRAGPKIVYAPEPAQSRSLDMGTF